ncbi:hypothetical protein QYE76_048091 [Lolium multiflorum]|uniref:CCHC-type domain-containing protein n=1 Tax=Lolium multiflorum TaxID=4521 RepID=A0AAD8X2K6_LOLMU|nr:hypothetical protein QYE76_048091 [Lolium multiflorum]
MTEGAKRGAERSHCGPRPRAARKAWPRHPVLWGPHSPFRLFFFAYSFVRKPKPQSDPHEGLQPPLRGGEHQREKSSPAGRNPGKFPPEGEIDAIAIVIKRDIISIIIIIISTIYTAITTAAPQEIKELEAQVLSLKKDLEKRHEGKSALDKMLSVQQSPNDKSGLGFNSNNKNKSKSKSNKKKGQDKVKDPAKLVCFKCKVEGHHVRSCPLKKKKKHLSEKQQGKRPQGQGQAHARPQVEDRPLPKKNQDIVPQEKKSIKKRKGNTCYLCRVKGHFASSCLSGTLSNPIIVDDDYSLGKDKDGNVFAKFVGTQSGLKKRTIWVAKPIVTNLLGPNLVGDQQAQT